ncbi:MAG: hypothetical protein JWM40_2407 [Frankiales bacterium]|nr:hypothetical protein [Frankiales bacterium]
MTETPSAPPQGVPPAPPASDRMQALLSRAVEEQVSEQRAVSTILAELRQQVHGLAEALRHTAADASVERLGGLVSNVVADLRTSTSLLGQRIEALSKRIDAVAADAAAPSQAAATSMGAMSTDIHAQAEAIGQMRAAMAQLGAFPAALAALQKDVAGMHDRLQPLADLRSTVAELGVASGGEGSGGPRLDAIESKLEELAQAVRPERVRDAVVDALAGRLAKLEEAASRPVVGPEVLRSAFGDFRASLDVASAERWDEQTAALTAVENRLGQVGQRIADIGDAAGAVPGLATDMAELGSKLSALSGLSDGLEVIAEGVRALQEQSTAEDGGSALAAIHGQLDALAEAVTAAAGPGAEELANAVSQRVADRLVETLAPRIADVVLTRVSGALVSQLGEALSPRLQADTEALVRNSVNDSERRVLAHLDEAVLALAEALLRRGKPRLPGAVASRTAKATDDSGKHAKGTDEGDDGKEPAAAWDQADEDVQGLLDRLNAAPSTPEPEDVSLRPEVKLPELPPLPAGVTTSMAPSSSAAAAPAKAVAPAPATPAKKAPAKKAAVKAPAKKASKAAKTSSVAKAAQSRSAAARKAAPVRPPEARRPAPKAVAKSARPIVDRTPDVPVDDIEPVRSASPPRATPRPLGRPTAATRQAGAAYRPDAPRPIERPSLARPDAPKPRGAREAVPKKKSWWKPGG